MTYRNQCRLRRYRRQLRRQRDILASLTATIVPDRPVAILQGSLTAWQRELLDAVMRGERVVVSRSRRNGMLHLAKAERELAAIGYTPSVEWRDEV